MAKTFGSRLAQLRRDAGLSQNDLADKLGVSQSNISFWERWDKPPRGEILPELAKALGISVDVLLGVKAPKAKKTVAQGRLQRVFERVSNLPRRQQQKVIDMAEAFVAQHSNGNGS